MRTAIAFLFLSASCCAQSIVVSGGDSKSITATGSQFIEQIENRLGVVETNVSKLSSDVSQIKSDVGSILERLDQKPIIVEPPQKPKPEITVVGEKIEPQPQPEKVLGRKKYLAMFTAPWCSHCQIWDRSHRHRLEAAGFVVRKYDMDLPENQAKYGNPEAKVRVTRLPTFIVCDWDTGEWIGDPIVGSVSANVLIPLLRTNEPALEPVPSNSSVVNGFADWGGVRYDLAKWRRMCSMRNCQMCNYLDAKQAEYFASLRLINSIEAPSPESASPEDVIVEGLDLLIKNGLSSDSLLCDPGCGDARVLIRAVERTGCFGVGIEIKPEKAKKARELVASRGLESRITIIEGDARDFDFEKSRVTHVYCYLYPDLLSELSGKLSKIPVVVSAGHRIPGLENQQAIGQCHLRLKI